MVAYRLKCTVCKKKFSTRASWHYHLTEPLHQKRLFRRRPGRPARNPLSLEDNPSILKSGLLVFASFPVTSVEVVEAFSNGKPSWFVVDFLVHPRKPKIAVVIFERRKVMKQVYDLVGPQSEIGGKLVQVQKCCTFPSLAWIELFPPSDTESDNHPSSFISAPLSPPSPPHSNIPTPLSPPSPSSPDISTPMSQPFPPPPVIPISQSPPTPPPRFIPVSHSLPLPPPSVTPIPQHPPSSLPPVIELESSTESSTSSEDSSDSDGSTASKNANILNKPKSLTPPVVQSQSSLKRRKLTVTTNGASKSPPERPQDNPPTTPSPAQTAEFTPTRREEISKWTKPTASSYQTPSPGMQTKFNLLKQYDEVTTNKGVAMSSERIQEVGAAFELIRTHFAVQFPSAAMYMYRDCGLKLESFRSDMTAPYFYLKCRERNTPGLRTLFGLRNTPIDIQQRRFALDFQIPKDKFKLVNMLSSIMFSSSSVANASHELTLATGEGTTVCVSVGDKYFLEAETDRMIQYLFTFDRRAIHLLKLVRYCLKANSVKLRMDQIVNIYKGAPVIYAAPNRHPSACDLLVMFFLCRKKVIPNPSQVLLPDKKSAKRISKSKESFGVNIAYTRSSKFRMDWNAKHGAANGGQPMPRVGTKRFVLSVLELTKEFLSFCTNLQSTSSSNLVINTKHTEILTASSSKPQSGQMVTKMKGEECHNVRRTLNSGKTRIPTPSAIIILHPLIVHACFVLSADNFNEYESRVLRQCAANLSTLIDECKASSKSEIRKASMDLASALDLGEGIRAKLDRRQNKDERGSTVVGRTTHGSDVFSMDSKFYVKDNF